MKNYATVKKLIGTKNLKDATEHNQKEYEESIIQQKILVYLKPNFRFVLLYVRKITISTTEDENIRNLKKKIHKLENGSNSIKEKPFFSRYSQQNIGI